MPALVVHQGKVVGPGDWASIVDEDTHRGIVAYLSDPGRVHKTGFERLYEGSGVYRSGVCGDRLHGWQPSGGKGRAYICADRHVRRQGEALDNCVDAIILGHLSKPDAASVWGNNAVDVGRLHAQREGLLARMDELVDLHTEGSITGPQLKRGTAKLATALDSCDAELAAATQGNPVAGLLTETGQSIAKLEKRWRKLSPDIRGKIIDQVLVVTVNRSPRGLRRFDPDYIDIRSKVSK